MNDFIVTLNNKKRTIKIVDDKSVLIDSTAIKIDLSKINEHLYLLKVGNKVYEITTTKISCL